MFWSCSHELFTSQFLESITASFVETLAGLIRQPKYGHLKELHRAIKLCEPALISADPIVTSLGPYQQVCGLYPASSHEIFGAPSTAYLILLEVGTDPIFGFPVSCILLWDGWLCSFPFKLQS